MYIVYCMYVFLKLNNSIFYFFLFKSILDPGTTSIGIYTPVVAFPSIDSIHYKYYLLPVLINVLSIYKSLK